MMRTLFAFFLIFSLQAEARKPLDGAQLTPPLPANLWIEMSRLSQPGVVGIHLDIDYRKSRMRRDPMFELLEEFFGGGYRYNDPRDESEEESSPIGTGFIIDKEGHIVTNYHVIKPSLTKRLNTKLQVQIFGQEKLLDVKILGGYERGDLALLKLVNPPKDIFPLQFGDSSKIQVGEYVAAFGNPYGHSNSMTVGIISALGRAIEEINRFPFIQTDASINPGNSGGPLLNTEGYVIGVNTAIDARAQGIGFAIPSNFAKRIINDLKQGKTIQRGYMGIGMDYLHPRAAREYGIKDNGIVVRSVQKGYPAAKAGLRPNDIIIAFNGKPIKDPTRFGDQIQDSRVGEVVKLKVLRPRQYDFKEMTFDVKLTKYPDEFDELSGFATKPQTSTPTQGENSRYAGKAVPYGLGFSVVDSSSGARRELDVPVRFPFGPIVTNVVSGSPASRGGIKPGFVVLRVNGQGVNSVSDILKGLRPGLNRFWVHTPSGEKKISLKSE